MQYKAEGVPLVVLAGDRIRHRQQPRLGRQGHATSWASAPSLASSFERIHRSNLVGMGVLPLELPPGQTGKSLGLSGEEIFDIPGSGRRLAAAAPS